MQCKFEIDLTEPKTSDRLFRPYVKFRLIQLNMTSECMTESEIDFQANELIKQVEKLRKEVKKKLREAQSRHDRIVKEIMKQIAHVRITLDDNVPESMDGIIRVGSVISEDENGNIIKDHQELVDNIEYHTRQELINSVGKRLNVDPSICEIVD